MRGRKPEADNVVPLTAGATREDFDAAAKAKARKLKPRGLDKKVANVWDRIAPRVCHPQVDRLREHMIEPFVLMCVALARHEELRTQLKFMGETYESDTRNGTQIKARPEVGQLNETFRQFLTLARDFGLTPAAERGLRNNSQGSLDFGDEDFA